MDYYQILEVSPGSSVEVIKAAYKVLAKKYHPDVYQGDKTYAGEMMQKINAAYEVLSNPESRAEYDRTNSPESEKNPVSEAEESYAETGTSVSRIVCPECGRSNPSDAAFCIFCGLDLQGKPFPSEPYETVSVQKDHSQTNHFLVVAMVVIIIPLVIYLCTRIPAIQAQQAQPASNSALVSGQGTDSDIILLKSGYLANYSRTKAIGDAFDAYFREPEWGAVTKNGRTEVQFEGVSSDISKNGTKTVTVVFTENGAGFQIDSWSAGGVEQKEDDISKLLKKIYGQE